MTDTRQPGDGLLDRYVPDADEESREAARAAFRDFAFLLLRIGERLEAEANQAADSTELGEGATLSETPPAPPSP
jgi:hypothetical protein